MNPFYTKPESTAERREFTERLGMRNAAPLWEVLGEIVPRYRDRRPSRRCGGTTSFGHF